MAGPATQPLSHSARVAGAATQPLRVAEWLSGCVGHSARVAEWLSGWCENFRHCAFNLILYILYHTESSNIFQPNNTKAPRKAFSLFSPLGSLRSLGSLGLFRAIFSEGNSGCAPKPSRLSRGLGEGTNERVDIIEASNIRESSYMGMDQYLLIPFLGGWTSIYQQFWGSLGTRVLTHPHMIYMVSDHEKILNLPVRHMIWDILNGKSWHIKLDIIHL